LSLNFVSLQTSGETDKALFFIVINYFTKQIFWKQLVTVEKSLDHKILFLAKFTTPVTTAKLLLDSQSVMQVRLRQKSG